MKNEIIKTVEVGSIILEFTANILNKWYRDANGRAGVMLTQADFLDAMEINWITIIAYLNTLKEYGAIESYEIMEKVEKDNLEWAQVYMNKKIDIELLFKNIEREKKILNFNNQLSFDLGTHYAKYKNKKPTFFIPGTDAHKLLRNFMEHPYKHFGYKELFGIIGKRTKRVGASEKREIRDKVRNICRRLGIKNQSQLFNCVGGYSLGTVQS